MGPCLSERRYWWSLRYFSINSGTFVKFYLFLYRTQEYPQFVTFKTEQRFMNLMDLVRVRPGTFLIKFDLFNISYFWFYFSF